eukprot:1156636-Pelagomonas_calceolata.AAC.6
MPSTLSCICANKCRHVSTALMNSVEPANACVMCIQAGGGGSAKATALMPYSNAPPEKESSSKGGPKRLLIMMSNTGGGHRASAEAIRDAFQEKYGEEYQVRRLSSWPIPFTYAIIFQLFDMDIGKCEVSGIYGMLHVAGSGTAYQQSMSMGGGGLGAVPAGAGSMSEPSAGHGQSGVVSLTQRRLTVNILH